MLLAYYVAKCISLLPTKNQETLAAAESYRNALYKEKVLTF